MTMTDITEHPTGEGKLYSCAVKDVWSNRIVGYSMAARMTAALAVNALEHAIIIRGRVKAVLHSHRGSQFRSDVTQALVDNGLRGSMGRVSAPATTQPWNHGSRCCRTTCSTATTGPPEPSSGPRSCTGPKPDPRHPHPSRLNPTTPDASELRPDHQPARPTPTSEELISPQYTAPLERGADRNLTTSASRVEVVKAP